MAKKEIEDHRPDVVKFFFKELLPAFDKDKDMIVMSKSVYDIIQSYDGVHALAKVSHRLMIWDSYLYNITLIRAGYGGSTNIPFFVVS